MGRTPHLVQYQGSKRIIAPEIVPYIPFNTERLVEPFSGTCAISILAAVEGRCNTYLLNDLNRPLINMMAQCVNDPKELTRSYTIIWEGQFEEGKNNIDYFYKIREEFNNGCTDPAHMLFLLARVVKGAVRYNDKGKMNQSCDKRRNGTNPRTIEKNAKAISRLLKGKTVFSSEDYKDVLSKTKKGDVVYMDPPYQGTSEACNSRDQRYIQGVSFDEFVEELEKLIEKDVDFIISYDGMTGEKKIGRDLPESLGLEHLYINGGLSSQALLNGKKAITYESLYLSKGLREKVIANEQLKIDI